MASELTLRQIMALATEALERKDYQAAVKHFKAAAHRASITETHRDYSERISDHITDPKHLEKLARYGIHTVEDYYRASVKVFGKLNSMKEELRLIEVEYGERLNRHMHGWLASKLVDGDILTMRDLIYASVEQLRCALSFDQGNLREVREICIDYKEVTRLPV